MKQHIGTIALISAFILGTTGVVIDAKTSTIINTFRTEAVMHVVKNGEESTVWFDANDQHYNVPGYNKACKNNNGHALTYTDGQHVWLNMAEMESSIRIYQRIQSIEVSNDAYICR